ncbi:hypothetical protein ACWDCB_20415 [Streptomyces sp. NPDC001178]
MPAHSPHPTPRVHEPVPPAASRPARAGRYATRRTAPRSSAADAATVRPGHTAPDTYRTARGDWLRRERRRRLVPAALIAVVFTLATLMGLWVLHQTPAHPVVIFSGAGSPGALGGGLTGRS